MKSNLDIWAIQYYPEELYTALSNIKDGLNIVYTNVNSEFKLGNKIVKGRFFDTFLYNEDSDIIIMLMKGCKVTKYDIFNYLEKNNKRYVEVNFIPMKNVTKDKNNLPELWFARDEEVLKDAIKDSINKNIKDCIIYPHVRGSLELCYMNNSYEKIEVDGRNIRDIIKLKDKVILLLNENIDYMELLNEYNIDIIKSYKKDPNIHVNNFSKTLKKLI